MNAVQLVAISDRDETTNAEQQGIFSNTFSLRAIEKETSVAPKSGSDCNNIAMVAGIAGGLAGLVVVAAFLVVIILLKRCKRNAAAMDSPLVVGAMSDSDL